MLGPLKINVEFAEYLIRHLTSPFMKKKAYLILISSKLVLFHANDLLDLRFLQTGNFTTNYAEHSPSRAIKEMTELINLTLEGKLVRVKVDIS